MSELSSKEQTLKAVQHFGDGSSSPAVIVKSSWLSRCIKTGTIANVEEEDHVKSEKVLDCSFILSISFEHL